MKQSNIPFKERKKRCEYQDKQTEMKFKEFKAWCNERACDGCWGMVSATICLNIVTEISRLPFWKRKKRWNEVKDWVVELIILPTNKKINEVYGNDRA
ncbi:MAG: hypothetical protein IKV53_07295 [Clostridia bacterium]|nr:hypothetical protein [Clostridia bacterium]